MHGIQEPYREVAATLIVGTCGRLLFQLRDDVPGIMYAGLIGLFGGGREGSEDCLSCVRREIEEELGLQLESSRFEPLAKLDIAYPFGGGVKGTFYILRDVQIDDVVVTEGSPLVVERSELGGLLARMSPTACLMTRLFMMLPAEHA
jgi:8-oxo-dGTP diphosphatase